MKLLKEIDPLEARYIAGFFDGEGSIGIYKSRRLPRTVNQTMYLSLAISNTDLNVLEFIRNSCGGCVIKAKFKTNMQVWHWHAYSREGAHILQTIFPYLRVKRAQALIALEFAGLIARSVKTRPKRRGMPRLTTDDMTTRASLALQLRRLKKPWLTDVSH